MMHACPRTPTLRLLALVWLAFAAAAGAQEPEAAAPRDASAVLAPEAEAVLDRFLTAWEAEDHAALAALLAPDGAVVSLGRTARPEARTSPAQAHYVFKSLFQGTADHVLSLESVAPHPRTATAVLEWRYRRGESRLRERLFLSLSDVDGWRVDAVRPGS